MKSITFDLGLRYFLSRKLNILLHFSSLIRTFAEKYKL